MSKRSSPSRVVLNPPKRLSWILTCHIFMQSTQARNKNRTQTFKFAGLFSRILDKLLKQTKCLKKFLATWLNLLSYENRYANCRCCRQIDLATTQVSTDSGWQYWNKICCCYFQHLRFLWRLLPLNQVFGVFFLEIFLPNVSATLFLVAIFSTACKM